MNNIKALKGKKIICKGWHQEAAMRMLQNNLDSNVAEIPDELIVYGGLGKAARNWESYDAIIDALKKLSSSLGSSFLKTVTTINNIKGRVVCCGVGKSAKILNKISSTFSSVGISSFVLDVTDANHGSLGSIKPTWAKVFSLYSTFMN